MVNTKTVVLRNQDAEGNVNVLYPRTHIDCVEGAADLETKANAALRFDMIQSLTDADIKMALGNLGIHTSTYNQWTPELSFSQTLSSGTVKLNITTANYFRIGNIVHFSILGRIVVSSDAAFSGDPGITISLPFPANGSWAVNLGLNAGTVTNAFSAYIWNGSKITLMDNGGNGAAFTLGAAGNGSYISLNGTYLTSAPIV